MAGFTDCNGHRRDLRITVADLKSLREVGFDPANLATTGEGLGDFLFGDPERLVAVACVMAHTPDTVTPEQFASGFDGPTLEAAGQAVVEAVVDFFPRSAVARSLREVVQKGFKEMDAKLIQTLSSGTAGNSPDTPGSTPGR